MTFVHVSARDGARPGVKIFVGTPDGEIDVPIVQRQRHIADRVGKIDTDRDAVLLRRFGDRRDVEQLAGEKIHASDYNDGELVGVFLDKIDNVVRSSRELAFARIGQNERVLRIKSV